MTTESSAQTLETRRLNAHEHLIFDVILRQAGTIGKAVLEGVQNAVDAEATHCDITVTATTIIIKDDGMGFTDRDEIVRCFEIFGQPQSDEERERKRYGEFRMGRGQLFAFGVNTWKSNIFTMEVDIKRNGLNYNLYSNGHKHPGCEITIRLYERLTPAAQTALTRELRHQVMYVPIAVTLNDERISKEIRGEKWTHEDDAAHYRLNDNQMLTIYNRGVHVMDLPASRYGVGGLVVSKQRLKTNFARNDAMSDCPVWKCIRKVLDANGTVKNTKKATLNDAGRQRLADQMITDDLGMNEEYELRVFTDVLNRHWSLKQFADLHHRYNGNYTVAPMNDRRADVAYQQQIAFVFAEDTVERFGMKDAESLMQFIQKRITRYRQQYFGRADHGDKWKFVPFAQVTAGISDDMLLLKPKECSPQDICAQRGSEAVLDHIVRCVAFSGLSRPEGEYSTRTQEAYHREYEKRHAIKNDKQRAIALGCSDTAVGWTDGATYIALNVKKLREQRNTLEGWLKIALLVLHEFCHDESDLTDHGHTMEFYQNFHDRSDYAAEAAVVGFAAYVRALKGKKLPLNRDTEVDANTHLPAATE